MNHNKTLAIAFTTLTVALTGVVFGSTGTYIASYTLDKEGLVTMGYRDKTATTKRITREEKKLLQKKTNLESLALAIGTLENIQTNYSRFIGTIYYAKRHSIHRKIKAIFLTQNLIVV